MIIPGLFYAGAELCLVFVICIAWKIRNDLWWQVKRSIMRYLLTTERQLITHRLRKTQCRADVLQSEIEQLERWSNQWNELRMNGYSPVWIDGYGWAENDGKCRHQQLWVRCAVCTAPDVRAVAPVFDLAPECISMTPTAEHAIRATEGMTAREFADRIQEMYVRRDAR